MSTIVNDSLHVTLTIYGTEAMITLYYTNSNFSAVVFPPGTLVFAAAVLGLRPLYDLTGCCNLEQNLLMQ